MIVFVVFLLISVSQEVEYFEQIIRCESPIGNVTVCRCITECTSTSQNSCHPYDESCEKCNDFVNTGYDCFQEDTTSIDPFFCNDIPDFEKNVCAGYECVGEDQCRCPEDWFGKKNCYSSAWVWFWDEYFEELLLEIVSSRWFEFVIIIICLVIIALIVLAFTIYCCGLKQNIKKAINYSNEKLNEKKEIQLEILYVQELAKQCRLEGTEFNAKLKMIQTYFFTSKTWKDVVFLSVLINLYYDFFSILEKSLKTEVKKQMIDLIQTKLNELIINKIVTDKELVQKINEILLGGTTSIMELDMSLFSSVEKQEVNDLREAKKELNYFLENETSDMVFNYWNRSVMSIVERSSKLYDELLELQNTVDLKTHPIFAKDKLNELIKEHSQVKMEFRKRKRETETIKKLSIKYKVLRKKFLYYLSERKELENKFINGISFKEFQKNDSNDFHLSVLNEFEYENSIKFLNEFCENAKAVKSDEIVSEVSYVSNYFDEEATKKIGKINKNLGGSTEIINLLNSLNVLEISLKTRGSLILSINEEKIQNMQLKILEKFGDRTVVKIDSPDSKLSAQPGISLTTEIDFSKILNFSVDELYISCLKKWENLQQQRNESIQKKCVDYIKTLEEFLRNNEDWNFNFYSLEFKNFLQRNYFTLAQTRPFFLLNKTKGLLKFIIEKKESEVDKIIIPAVLNIALLLQICLVRQRREDVLIDIGEKMELIEIFKTIKEKFSENHTTLQYHIKFLLENLKIFKDDGSLSLQIFGVIKIFDFSELLKLLYEKKQLILENKSRVSLQSWFKSYVIEAITHRAMSSDEVHMEMINNKTWKELISKCPNKVILDYVNMIGEMCLEMIGEHNDLIKIYVSLLLKLDPGQIDMGEMEVLKYFVSIPRSINPNTKFFHMDKKIVIDPLKWQALINNKKIPEENKKGVKKEKKKTEVKVKENPNEEVIKIIELETGDNESEGSETIVEIQGFELDSAFDSSYEYIKCSGKIVGKFSGDSKKERITNLKNVQYSNFLQICLFKFYWNHMVDLFEKLGENELFINTYVSVISRIFKSLGHSLRSKNWTRIEKLLSEKGIIDLQIQNSTTSRYFFFSKFLKECVGESQFLNFKLNLREKPLSTLCMFTKKSEIGMDKFIKIINSTRKNIVLVSKGGTGKSCLFRFLTVNMKESDESEFPFYLKADLVAEKAGKRFVTASFEEQCEMLTDIALMSVNFGVGSRGIQTVELKNEIMKILRTEKIVLVIDGFDEISDIKRNLFMKILEMLQNNQIRDKESSSTGTSSNNKERIKIGKIFLSSRPSAIENNEFSSFFSEKNFMKFHINKLTPINCVKLMEKILHYNHLEKESILSRYNKLEKSFNDGNPLILVLLLKRLLDTEKEDDRLLRTKFLLYQNILFSSIETDKRRKIEPTNFSRLNLQSKSHKQFTVAICNTLWLMDLLSLIAYLIHRTGKSEKDFILQLLNNNIALLIGNEKWLKKVRNPVESIVDSIVSFCGLLNLQGDILNFSHRTVQEFFAARFLIQTYQNNYLNELLGIFNCDERLFFSFHFKVQKGWAVVYDFLNDYYVYPFKSIEQMLSVKNLIENDFISKTTNMSDHKRGRVKKDAVIQTLRREDVSEKVASMFGLKLFPEDKQDVNGKYLVQDLCLEMKYNSDRQIQQRVSFLVGNFQDRFLECVLKMYQFYDFQMDVSLVNQIMSDAKTDWMINEEYFQCFSYSARGKFFVLNIDENKYILFNNYCLYEVSNENTDSNSNSISNGFGEEENKVPSNYIDFNPKFNQNYVKLIVNKTRKKVENEIVIGNKITKLAHYTPNSVMSLKEKMDDFKKREETISLSTDLKFLREVFYFENSDYIVHLFFVPKKSTILIERHKYNSIDHVPETIVSVKGIRVTNEGEILYAKTSNQPEGILFSNRGIVQFYNVRNNQVVPIDFSKFYKYSDRLCLYENWILRFGQEEVSFFQINPSLNVIPKQQYNFTYFRRIKFLYPVDCSFNSITTVRCNSSNVNFIVVFDNYNEFHYYNFVSKKIICSFSIKEFIDSINKHIRRNKECGLKRVQYTSYESIATEIVKGIRFYFVKGVYEFHVKFVYKANTIIMKKTCGHVDRKLQNRDVIDKIFFKKELKNLANQNRVSHFMHYFHTENTTILQKKSKFSGYNEKNDQRLNSLLESLRKIIQKQSSSKDVVITPQSSNHIEYAGQQLNNRFHGFGVLYYPDGSKKYVGQFEHGKFNGEGEFHNLKKEDHNLVKGEFFRGFAVNKDENFVQYFSNGDNSYIGEVNKTTGRFEGVGKKWYTSKAGLYHVYEGEFKDGKRNGKGKYEYRVTTLRTEKPSIYEGEWKNDQRSGSGKCVYGNSRIYEGEYKNDKRHGFGKFFGGNLKVDLEGQWENDNLVFGKEMMNGKVLYEGSFHGKNNSGSGNENYLRNGKGKVYDYPKEGDMFEGELSNNTIEKGKIIYKNGDTYEGEFQSRNRHGIGEFVVKDSGNVYKGQFFLDKMTGVGKMVISSTGEEYYGEIKNGVFNGLGIFSAKKGDKYHGMFKNNKKIGQFLKNSKECVFFEDGEEKKIEDPEKIKIITQKFNKRTIIAELEEKKKQTKELFVHTGYSCDNCATIPIIGIRYHCKTKSNYDLCPSCFEKRKEIPKLGLHDWTVFLTNREKGSVVNEAIEKKRCTIRTSTQGIPAKVCNRCVGFGNSLRVKCCVCGSQVDLQRSTEAKLCNKHGGFRARDTCVRCDSYPARKKAYLCNSRCAGFSSMKVCSKLL